MALDAASRGLRTALVERDDFASGTSSKSSKLVHGGLRYLQNGDVRLVYEALRERQRLRHNAPHLVRLLPFLIPLFSKDGLINPKVARALGTAMWMYDLTGGARIGKLHKRLKKHKAVEHMPTIPVERLAGAYLYYDAAADDARLTLTLARTAAVDHGAVVVNHTRVVALLHDADGHVRGATVEAAQADGTATTIEVAARAVVNAAGRVVRRRARPRRGAAPRHASVPPRASTSPCRGRRCGTTSPSSCRCRRTSAPCSSCRGCPNGDGTYQLTYIGTTDTDYDGPVDDPQCTADDVAYLLSGHQPRRCASRSARPTSSAPGPGLRPLVKAPSSGRTADLSRRHKVLVSDSGMVSVTGGKLTTYREMAEDTVEAVRASTSTTCRRSAQAVPHPHGCGCWAPATCRPRSRTHLAGRYGSEARVLAAMIEADPDLGAPLVDGLPYLRAEALYAVRHEMARSVDDVLARRTRARLQARDASAAAARSRRRAHRRRARLVGRPRRARQAAPTTRSSTPSDLPASRAALVPRSSDDHGAARPARAGSRRPHAADRARGRRRGGHRAPRRHAGRRARRGGRRRCRRSAPSSSRATWSARPAATGGPRR